MNLPAKSDEQREAERRRQAKADRAGMIAVAVVTFTAFAVVLIWLIRSADPGTEISLVEWLLSIGFASAVAWVVCVVIGNPVMALFESLVLEGCRVFVVGLAYFGIIALAFTVWLGPVPYWVWPIALVTFGVLAYLLDPWSS